MKVSKWEIMLCKVGVEEGICACCSWWLLVWYAGYALRSSGWFVVSQHLQLLHSGLSEASNEFAFPVP